MPQDLVSYTFGGMYRDPYDVRVADKVAAAFGQAHTVFRLDSDFLKQFPALSERVVYLTDGGLDLSGVPNLYVNGKARAVAPVRMTGNYGSEVLRRHGAFKQDPPEDAVFSAGFLPSLKNVGGLYAKQKACNRLTFAVFKQAPWYQYCRLALEQSQLTLRTPFMDNELVKMMYQAPESLTASNGLSLRLIKDGNPRLAEIPTDRGVGGVMNPLKRKWERFHHEFTFKMDYYANHGMPQWVSKVNFLLGPLSPEKVFLGRHKYYHLRIWFRDELRDFVRGIMLDSRSLSRPYLEKKAVISMVTAHTRGYGNHTHSINKLLSIELVNRLLIEG
jgi:asparagine synthase (glutamine-hydrolysing)